MRRQRRPLELLPTFRTGILPHPRHLGLGLPVLLAFPPGSMDKGAVRWGVENFWGSAAADRGWVVISPAKPEGGWYTKAAKGYITALLDDAARKYKIEGGKFHVAGCSNGGAAAFHVAIEAPSGSTA